jgi:ABC-2 type transport system permease protein
MSVFTAVFSTCLKRARFLKGQIAVFLIMMIALVEFAVFIGMPTQKSLHLAVVGVPSGITSGQALAATKLDRDPGEAAIALGRYDLIFGADPSGKPIVLHARSEALAKAFLSSGSLSSSPSFAAAPKRGMASIIMGYLIVVLFELGVIGSRLLMEDREWKLTGRVAAATPGLRVYIASHGAFVFALCFLPAFILIVGQGMVMGTGLGLDVAGWALLLGVTALLGAAFAILVAVASPDEDQGSTVAQMIIIFTTLLSGSFIAVSDQGPTLKFLAAAMPQKYLMDFCAALEGSLSTTRPLIALGAYIVAILAGAIIVMRIRLQRGSC